MFDGPSIIYYDLTILLVSVEQGRGDRCCCLLHDLSHVTENKPSTKSVFVPTLYNKTSTIKRKVFDGFVTLGTTFSGELLLFGTVIFSVSLSSPTHCLINKAII